MTEYQSVIDLAQKAERDGTLRQALERCQSPDDVAQVAAKAGLKVTADELREFSQSVQALQRRAADGELSDADLEAVAGGWLMAGALVAGVIGLGGLGAASGGIGLTAGVGLGVMGTLIGIGATRHS